CARGVGVDDSSYQNGYLEFW
nr:immunoglobulin heavy chain junction region [Macaca mulatta]